MQLQAKQRLMATDRLRAILKSIIGAGTIVAEYQYDEDPDKDLIAARGKDYTQIGKLYKGPPGQCHWNVAKLYEAGMIDAIVIGYAHNFQGWHQHTWGLVGSSLVETTIDNKMNDHWFGAKLTPKQSKVFVDRCKRFPPGNGMIRTYKGGAL